MSVGLGLFFVPLNSVALAGIAPRDAGVASAMLNMTQQIGDALGPALLNTLYVAAVTSYVTFNRPSSNSVQAFQFDSFLHGYRTAFIVGSCLFALALLIVIFLSDAREGELSGHHDTVPAQS